MKTFFIAAKPIPLSVEPLSTTIISKLLSGCDARLSKGKYLT
jgi:hypothetical protein